MDERPHTRRQSIDPPDPATQSAFLRRFLRRAGCATDLPSSGLADLDERIGGGLLPGLHLLAGPAGDAKTALLLSAVWEAVSTQRPAVYYAFREGDVRAWMRLVSTLASFQAGDTQKPAVSLDQLRASRLSASQLEVLRRLDRLLQASVFPLLSLVDSVPERLTTLDAFTEDVRIRIREFSGLRGRVPLVIIDDLDRLLQLTPQYPLESALIIIDEALREECAPGIVAAVLPESMAETVTSVPAQTVLLLDDVRATSEEGFGRATLHVGANAPTGWTGTLPLLLDLASGLFASESVRGA